jgi:peptide/nickel transport system permease protein
MILHHALPNAIGPVLTALAFGMANAILIESFLSFIGLGFPPDTATWGSLLNAGRQDLSSWWLSVFPGLAIFLIVLSLNVSGEKWRFRHRKEKI